MFPWSVDRGGAGKPLMNKNVKIDDRTHVRLKKEANKTGRLIGPLATELIGSALDAKSSSVKSTKTKKQP